MRPLERIRSLKLKLGVVIVAGIVVALAVFVTVDDLFGNRRVLAVGIAVTVALAAVQILARGMTVRLREMARAAEAMARGEHGQRVEVGGHDEVAQLAEAFNAMSAELEQTDRMRRDLVANVAHELRTPLTALRATLENLIDGVQPVERHTLVAMREQLERLARMVEQLLDLSRMEAGEAMIEPRRCSAAELLEAVRSEAAPLAPASITVGATCAPLDLQLTGDPERVHQVLVNLVQNAIRFSPDDGRVELSASRQNGSVSLTVSDEGPGIPPAERQRVFERFYSVDESRSGSGAGLGLAISRWIVDLHGGAIRVEGREPRGCRVVVELPDERARSTRS